MEEDVPNKKKRIHKILRRYSLLAILFSVIFFTVVLAFFMSTRSARDESAKESNQIERITAVSQAPSVDFNTYALATALPRAKASANFYILKETFSQQEIEGVASQVGLRISENDGRFFLATNLENPEQLGTLVFDASTGGFEYTSYGVYRPASTSSPRILAESALRDFGVLDEYTSCGITYQRTDTPETTFVECHRDWARLGAPLVNLGGVLNIPETTSLSRVQVGTVDTNTPEDQAVINVSNGGNGRSRPNDFNSATVAVRNGRVVSVVSNLRWLEAVEEKNIITPTQAFSLFQNKKAQFSLTIPAGSGFTEWGNVYPQNKAVGSSAIVEDISLVYLDKPSDTSQQLYEPMYLVRGSSRLDSGYTVKFTQLLPAETGRFAQDLLSTSVAGARTLAQSKDNLQLDSFTPSATPVSEAVSPTLQPEVTNTPTIPPVTSTPTPTQPPANYCANIPSGSTVLNLDIPGYGQLTVSAGYTSAKGDKWAHSFYMRAPDTSKISLSSVRTALFKKVEDQYVINVSKFIDNGSFNTKNIANVQAVKTIFTEMNKSEERPCPTIAINSARPAPVRCPYRTYAEAAGMEDRVAQRIFSLIQGDKIDAQANLPDLLPVDVNRNLHFVMSDEPKYQLEGAPGQCYVSGATPILFAYSPSSQNASVSLNSQVIYAEPSLHNNTWSFISSASGILRVHGLVRDRMYYEYDKNAVQLDGSGKGYVVRAEELESLANSIAQKLGLNATETQALAFEFNHAKNGLSNAKYIQIELVLESEVSSKLPFSVSPNPGILHRVHFLLSKSNKGTKISPPNLSSLSRSGFTIIELGATSN